MTAHNCKSASPVYTSAFDSTAALSQHQADDWDFIEALDPFIKIKQL